jgi:hypothetical protein
MVTRSCRLSEDLASRGEDHQKSKVPFFKVPERLGEEF